MAAAAAASAVVLAGCTAGPDYHRPDVALPVTWTVESPWREAAPDDAARRAPWWQRYEDPELDALENAALAGSQTLAAAEARLTQARATVNVASAGLYPQLGLNSRLGRLKISEDRPLTNYSTPNHSTVQNDFLVGLAVSYEIDLAGRVRRTVEGAKASAEQSAADLENTRLLVTAELATDYFSLRALDAEIDVVRRSLALQGHALELAKVRHDLGASSGLDVAQQQALLDSTKTQVDVLGKQRAQFEHAIATLTGTPAPTFSLAPRAGTGKPPAIPLGVPSDLLQRRPDVASAERAMAAANAQVGVATAAFYPSIQLLPTYGVESTSLSSLFNASSLLWSVGVSIAQPLYDAGRIRANVDFTRGGYDVTVANYRRIVLTAMQEAEDGITGLSALERANNQAGIAVASSRHVLELANARYDGGVATYLDVITAQQGLLNNERLAAQLQGQWMITSVFLVKALGGDWQGPAAAPPVPATRVGSAG